MELNTTTSKSDRIAPILQDAYKELSEGSIVQAIQLLEESFKQDFEHPLVVPALKCATFWKERLDRLPVMKDPAERGEYLLTQWKTFQAFEERVGAVDESCRYSIRRLVFSRALEDFTRIDQRDADLVRKIGICHKKLGQYELAIKCFESVCHQRRDDAGALSELADCYALINEEKAAKVFFREAFFLNPQAVDLGSLESDLIVRLVEAVRTRGYGPPLLEEWIPVYGVLYNVFTVKRELRSIEIGRLKQAIYSMETQIAEDSADRKLLVPRLIHHYFWLIDHLHSTKEPRSSIDDTIKKIQKIDSTIYDLYVKGCLI